MSDRELKAELDGLYSTMNRQKRLLADHSERQCINGAGMERVQEDLASNQQRAASLLQQLAKSAVSLEGFSGRVGTCIALGGIPWLP